MNDVKIGSRAQALKVPGIPCPQCGVPIVIDPMVLLAAGTIACAACDLQLTINRQESAESLNALRSYLQVFDGIQSDLTEELGPSEEKRGKRAPGRRRRRR